MENKEQPVSEIDDRLFLLSLAAFLTVFIIYEFSKYLLYVLLIFLLLSLIFLIKLHLQESRNKKKTFTFLKLSFPSTQIGNKDPIQFMTDFLDWVYSTLEDETLSFEIHKNQKQTEVILGCTNTHITNQIREHLTAFGNIDILSEQEDVLPRYQSHFIARYVLRKTYIPINENGRGFLDHLIHYFSSIKENETGCVLFCFRPARPFFSERYNPFSTKKRRHIFQLEVKVIASNTEMLKSIGGLFGMLTAENAFLRYPVWKKSFTNSFPRLVHYPFLSKSFFRKTQVGSLIASEQLAIILHPVAINRGQYKSNESVTLEARSEFLEKSESNIFIGTTIRKTGEKKEVFLPINILDRHIYLAGKTGSGKSTVITTIYEGLAEQDSNRALIVLDPHGADTEYLVRHTKERDRVIYLDATSDEFTFTFNPLFSLRTNAKQKEAQIEQIMEIIREETEERDQNLGTSIEKLLGFLISSGVHFADAYCFYLEHELGMEKSKAEAIAQEKQLTLPDLPYILRDSTNFKQALQRIFSVYPNELQHAWKNLQQDFFLTRPIIDGLENRLQFISSATLQPILEGNKLNLLTCIHEKKHILIPLTETAFGVRSKRIFSKFLLSNIWSSYQGLQEEDRTPLSLFIDECEDVQMPIVENLLSKTRKYKISLILGNQYLEQLLPSLKSAILGNASTLFTFTLGNAKEAEEMAQSYQGKVTAEEINALPPFHAFLRTLNEKGETAVMSYETVSNKDVKETIDSDEFEGIKRKSLMEYGEEREVLMKRHADKLTDAEKYFLQFSPTRQAKKSPMKEDARQSEIKVKKPVPISEVLLQRTKQTKINSDEEKLTFIINEISIAFGDSLHQETNSREIYKFYIKLKKEKGIDIETMIDMIARAKALTKESGIKVKQKIPYFFKILKSFAN